MKRMRETEREIREKIYLYKADARAPGRKRKRRET